MSGRNLGSRLGLGRHAGQLHRRSLADSLRGGRLQEVLSNVCKQRLNTPRSTRAPRGLLTIPGNSLGRRLSLMSQVTAVSGLLLRPPPPGPRGPRDGAIPIVLSLLTAEERRESKEKEEGEERVGRRLIYASWSLSSRVNRVEKAQLRGDPRGGRGRWARALRRRRGLRGGRQRWQPSP